MPAQLVSSCYAIKGVEKKVDLAIAMLNLYIVSASDSDEDDGDDDFSLGAPGGAMRDCHDMVVEESGHSRTVSQSTGFFDAQCAAEHWDAFHIGLGKGSWYNHAMLYPEPAGSGQHSESSRMMSCA